MTSFRDRERQIIWINFEREDNKEEDIDGRRLQRIIGRFGERKKKEEKRGYGVGMDTESV